MSRFFSLKSFGLSILATALFFSVSPAAVAQSADAGVDGSSSARALVTAPVDAGQRVPLSGSLPAVVEGSEDRGALDAAHEISGVQLVMRRSKEQQQALQQLLQHTQDARDPMYGKALSPQIFGETFGVAQSDVQAVTAWLASSGVRVDEVKYGGRVLVISGRAVDFEGAFGTELHNYRAPDGTEYFANNSVLAVPAALKHSIAQVLGLQTYSPQSLVAFDGPQTRVHPTANLAQTSNAAPNTNVGSTSATQSVTLTPTATSVRPTITALTQGVANLEFKIATGGTCTAATVKNVSCTVQFTFAPKAAGQRLGAIQLTSGGTIIGSAFVSGVGVSGLGLFSPAVETPLITNVVEPRGVTFDASGNLYYADEDNETTTNGTIWKLAAGTTTPVALASGLNSPVSTAVDGAGNVFFGQLYAGAGNAVYELVGGTGTPVNLSSATVVGADDDMVVDGAGNVYFSSNYNCTISVVAAGAKTSTTLVAGGQTLSGTAQGRCIALALDPSNNLFMADYATNRIYEVTAASIASGSPAVTVVEASDGYMNGPHGLAIDLAGDLYLSNYGGGGTQLYRYQPNGSNGYTVSTVPNAIAKDGVAIDGAGNLYTISGNTIYELTRSVGASLTFPSTQVGNSSAQQIVSIENDGNAPLSISALTGTNANFSGAGTTCSTTVALTASSVCNLGVVFAPTVVGNPLTGTANVVDNNLQTPGTLQVVQVTGIATGIPTTLSNLTVSPSSVVSGSNSPVKLTESFAYSGTAAPTGGVTFTLNGVNYAATCTGSSSPLTCTYTVPGTTVAALGAASYTVTSAYPGDTHYAASSASGTFVVSASIPNTTVGTTSPTQTGTLTFTASGTLASINVLTTGIANLDYKYVAGGTCTVGTAYTAGQTCTVEFSFTPAYPGQRLGAIELATSAPAMLATAFLNGVGVSPLGIFQGGTTSSVTTGVSYPFQVKLDAANNVYSVGSNSPSVYKVVSGSSTATVLGMTASDPLVATAVDGAGNVYAVSQNSGGVYELAGGTGTLTAIASLTAGSTDDGMAVDGAGNVYVPVNLGSGNGYIAEIQAGSHTVSYAVNGGQTGCNGAEGRIIGIAMDSAGDMFLADYTNNCIYKVAAKTSTLTTIVNNDGKLNGPFSISVDAAGDLYVNSVSGQSVVRYSYNGSTYTGSVLSNVSALGGVTVDPGGNLYLSQGGSSIAKYTRATAPTLTYASTVVGTSSAQQLVGYENDGNAAETFSSLTGTNSNFNGAGETCLTSATLATGAACNFGVEFAPTTYGAAVTGNANVTDNTLAAAGTVQPIPVVGPATGDSLGAITFSPTTVAYGSSTALTISESISYYGTAAPTGALTFVFNGVTYTATCTGSSSPLSCSATVPAATVAALSTGSYSATSAYAGAGQYNSTTGASTSPFVVTAQTPVVSAITVTPSSVTYGSSTSVTLSETIAYNGSVAPAGAVTFTLNGVNYTATCTGSSSPLSCMATVPAATVAALTASTYTVTSSQAAAGNFGTDSGTGTFTVTKATVTLGTLMISPTSVAYGTTNTSVTLTQTLGYTGAVHPSNGFFFTLNGVNYTPVCSNGSGANGSPISCTATVPAATVAALPANAYTVSSTYNGDTNYSATGSTGTFTVTKLTPSFGTVTFNPTTVVYGANTTVTITVPLSYTGPTAPTGAVTFTTFGQVYTATCTGSSSPLSCTYVVAASVVSTTPANTYPVTPTYTADTDYNGTTGTTSNFVVSGQAPTLSSITASPSSVAYGSSAPVTLTETVNYTGSTTPSGTMTYTLNGVNYTATCMTVSNSTTQLSCTATVPGSAVAALPLGTDSITSSYSAAGNYTSATGSGSLTVTAGTPTFGTVTFSPTNTVPYGTSEVITISVPLNYTGSVAPNGMVSFSGDGSTWKASCTGSSSPLTCTAMIPATTVQMANVGVYPITPSITASGNYGSLMGNPSSFTVTQGNLTFGSTTTLSPAGAEAYGTSQAVTFTDSLSYLGVSAPTGQPSVSIGGYSYYATCTGSSGSPLSCSYTLPAAAVAALNAGTYAIVWSDTSDANYLAASLTQSNSFVISQAVGGLTLVAATPGTTTTGVTTTVLTATMSPVRSGVTVTFTDATTGVVLGTGVTNSSGVATLTINTSTTGVAAGLNNITASYTGNSNYTSATSTASTVYLQGLLLSTDLYHDFSSNPGTYDGSPVCNSGGTNGTAGSTCTQSYGIVVTNFTPSTQVIQQSFTNASSGAFSSATNCPAAGLASGKTCNIVFYYNPPYGDGCTLNTTTCVQGTFEQATWSVSATNQITGIGNLAFNRSGATSFPADLVGKALLTTGNSLSMTPLNLTFGPQAPGTVPTTQNIFVTNTEPQSQNVTYSVPGAPFTVVNNCGATLAGGATCEIQVSYTSSTAGSTTGHVVATPQVGNVITATVTGTTSANSGLSLTTTSHNFGSITDGTSSQFGLGIKNNAATPATLTFTNNATAGYTFYNGCPNPLPAGANCQVDVTFAPTAAGATSYSLTVHSNVAILPNGTGSNGTYTDVVAYTGTGVAGGTLTATSTGHNFGTVKTASEATAYGVQLSNNTSVALTMTLGGGTFGSNGAADGYTMQTNCPATLAVNANCEVVFSYTPAAVGTTQVAFPVSATHGSTSYAMNSGGSTYSSITLTGTGD